MLLTLEDLLPLAPLFVWTVVMASLLFYLLIYDRVDYTIFYDSNGRLSRRLGFFEKLFLTMAEVQSRGSVATVLLLESTVKLSKESLHNALLMVLKRFPLLRMRVTEKREELYFEEMEDPQRLDFTTIDDVTVDNWLEVFERQVNGEMFDVRKGPLWRVLLLKEVSYKSGSHGTYKNAIVFKFHHVIGDALAIFELKKKLLEYLDFVYYQREFEVKSLPFRPPIEVLMGHQIKPKIWVNLNRKLNWFSGNPKPRNLYLAVFPPADRRSKRMTCVVPRSLDVNETSAIVKCSKANKCTVNGAVTAATHLAMARLLLNNSQDLKTPLFLDTTYTVNIRNECKPKIGSEEFGLYATSNTLQMSIPSEDAGNETFWDFARECTNTVREGIRKGSHLNFLNRVQYVDVKTLHAVNSNDVDHAFSQTLFLLMNLGSIQINQNQDSPYRFAGAHLGVKSDNNGYIFRHAMFTVNGKLYWSMDYFPHLTSKIQAEEFLDLSLDILLKACVMSR